MAEKSFVHYHVHADGSQLDGLSNVEDLVSIAEELGQPGIALTDHGNMSATYDLYKAAKGTNVKPIFGMEAYLAPQVSRLFKEPVRWDNEEGENQLSGNGSYTHMTLLAQTDEGLHNLMKISSEAYLGGYYYKPRADDELLAQYSKGVIATSGCVSGEIQTLLRLGKYKEAKESAMKFRDIFGKENFYIEVMDHGLDIERQGLKDLIRLARELKIPIVATNDTHYSKKSDARVHEALLSIGTGSTLDNPQRFKFDSDEFYIKSATEMRKLWDTEVPEACDNTLLICESITATFHEGKDLLPAFDVPEGETEASWLEKEVHAGLARRYPNGIEQDRLDRAKYELGVINKMGFASYFLVTADFIQWSKNNGMRVGPGRGSAAGSLVAYALGITDLDPIRHGLLFERFLNSERVSMPDIDIDFDIRYRENVIQYVANKYGHDKVANISTRMMIKAKSGVKDSARVLGSPYGLGDRLNKVYPKPIVGRDLSLADLYDPENERYDEGTEFRELVAADPDAKEIVELAKGLEGTIRGFGMHAAGIIMSREPLNNTVPLMKKDNKEDSPIMTQFEYPADEALGLLKMDFLGLSNLTTISECLRIVKKNKNIDVDLEAIGEALDDEKTFKLLARGDTLGVFQLDSAPMRSLLRLMAPDKFNDIAAVLSLFRPGPMGAGSPTTYADRKNGRKRVVPIHPELDEPLKDILDETFGVICYQEQVMSIAQRVAGYSLAQADLLRRAMGKKSKEILDKEFNGFAQGMKNNGYSDDCIKTLWEILVPFADYAFNKCVSFDTTLRLPDDTAILASDLLKVHNSGEEIFLQSMWPDGAVRPHKVASIVSTGMKSLLRLKTQDGRKIMATPDHRLMTTRGYLKLEDMQVGIDELIVADQIVTEKTKEIAPSNTRKTHANPLTKKQIETSNISLGFDSENELNMAEFLTESGISFEMNKLVGRGQCDFYFNGQYWEMDGMDRHISYFERKYGDIPFIVVTPEDYRERISTVLGLDTVRNGDLIVSIEPVLNQDTPTLDIEMASEGPKNFITWNGIVSHNSHAAAYGMIAYWTAYLKCHYPAEYMAALLSTNSGDKDKLAIYLAECRRMGLKVLSPDINLSELDYTAVGEDVRVGLASIKGVGEKSVEAWIAQRNERGFAKSFSDFLETADPAVAKKNVVAALIKAGAFGAFGKTRASLYLVYEEALTRAAALRKGKSKKGKGTGVQSSLFGDDDTDLFSILIPDVPEWNRQELLSYERDMLGLYVSDHPLSDLTEAITSWQDISIADLKDGARVGVNVKLAGLVSSFERKVTKKGDPWALIILEDLDASIPVYAFPRTYNQAASFLAPDAIVIITGKSELREDGSYAFMASAITAPNLDKAVRSDPALWRERQVANDKVAHESGVKLGGDSSDVRPVRVKVLDSELTEKNIAALKKALAESPGYRPVEIHLLNLDRTVSSIIELEERVVGNATLAAEIRYIFGHDAV